MLDNVGAWRNSIVVIAMAVAGAAHAANPQAVKVARTTTIPACTLHVDASAAGGDGSAAKPLKTIAAAVEAAQPGAVICVAEGGYAEELKPGEKFFTLAGGFQKGSGFKVRDSAKYISKAKGNGSGSFLRIVDPGPKEGLTAIDGFEITGYSQAIVRDFYEPQRFDVTNNHIHDNKCGDVQLVGAGFALNNTSGTIAKNVIRNNSCGRGGAGFINDATNNNSVTVEGNLVDGNSGTEPDAAHGGGLYLFSNKLSVVGNEIINNSVTKWGGGLYVGAYTQGNQPTTATMAWNVYRGNRAGDSGGGFFCDDGAVCTASHEVYDGNCGGNVLVDGGSEGSAATRAKFDHVTSVNALEVGCGAPGIGLYVDTYDGFAADTYAITNSIFWGNAPEKDIATSCGKGCQRIKVDVSNTLMQTHYAKDGGIAVNFGAGMIESVDPQFVDAAKGDFRLKPGSPAAGKASDGTDLGAFGKGSAAPEQSAASKPAPPVVAAAAVAPAAPTAPPAEKTPEPPPVEKSEAPAAPAPAVAAAQSSGSADDVTAKDAFEAARELGTNEAWGAFLSRFPSGFYADLARAYINKLGGAAAPAATPSAAAAVAKPSAPAAAAPPAKPAPAAQANITLAPPAAGKPAIARGASFMGFPEKFNRYYTDPSWKPSAVVYVSPAGGGNGAAAQSPKGVKEAVAAAKPGTMIRFLPGDYQGCFEFTKENSGTYDAPVVLYAERGAGNARGVKMTCCSSGRQTCFNLEDADYVAIDGFELIGGKYGVRAIGRGYPQSEHSRGVAIISCNGHDQGRDPFFSAQADWAVWEGNVASGAKKDDGHGMYLSNGGDWNIVRFNETFNNVSSDFQINADPASTCAEPGIPFNDPRCDAYAGEGEGGQGASDYFLVDGNYFHHGAAGGPNFTSVRRSVVRNNVFGPQTRHNVSFWQETDNPKLGSSDNKILHNLFITTAKHGVKFEANSTRNLFANNVLVGVSTEGGKASANPKALLMEVDDTAGDNTYRDNLYISGHLEGREPGEGEQVSQDFSAAWFKNFPVQLNHDPNDYTPTAGGPLLGKGKLFKDAPVDRNGVARPIAPGLGPIEAP